MTCCKHSSLHIWISLSCFLCPHQLFSHMHLKYWQQECYHFQASCLSFFAVPWQAVLSFHSVGLVVTKREVKLLSKNVLQVFPLSSCSSWKYSLPPPSPVLPDLQPHVRDSLVPAPHEAHTWNLLLWNQAPMYWHQLFKQGHNHWLPVVLGYLTPGASDSVRGTEHTEACATGAEDNKTRCQSPSPSPVVLCTSTLQLILPAGR